MVRLSAAVGGAFALRGVIGMAFEKVRPQVDFPALEKEVLGLWEEIGAFQKSVERRPEDRPFVFYEGPPTANGRPGFHHALSRAFKDLIPRYKTMQGYRVERKAGWDTHGLPVEIQVEKELGLSGKDDIERYGVEEFNRLCRESVFRYVEDWRAMTERLGFWIDMEHPYRTLDNSYIAERLVGPQGPLREGPSLRGLQGQRPLPPRPDLPLGRRGRPGLPAVPRPRGRPERIRKAFRWWTSRNTSLLIWTTTPWTLISNAAVAAHPDVDYATAEVDGERLILARDLLETRAGRGELRGPGDAQGCGARRAEVSAPLRLRARGGAEEHENLWTVVLGSTSPRPRARALVHIAPAYGEEDARLGRRYGLPTDPPRKARRDVRPARRTVRRAVREGRGPGARGGAWRRALLFRAEEYEHAYPTAGGAARRSSTTPKGPGTPGRPPYSTSCSRRTRRSTGSPST